MRHGWLPARREDILRMAKIWLGALNTPKAVDWRVPPAERTALEPLVTLAEQKLTAVKSSERTPIIATECREAFEALIARLRLIKTGYFKAPSLIDSDFTLLELNIPDTIRSPRGTPKAQMTAEIGRSDTAMLIRLVCLRLVYAEGMEALGDIHTDIEFQARHGKYSPVSPVSNAVAGEIAVVPLNPLELPVVSDILRHHTVNGNGLFRSALRFL